tara:strand:- start:411 stop:953 length:543 start_codon:yes stop_codon:yes gene_type:complete
LRVGGVKIPFKDPVKRKAYQKRYHEGWYAENGDHRREQVKRRRRELKQRYRAYKETLSCCECGHSGKDNAWSLDFDHIDPDNKIVSVSHLVTSGYGWERIMEEIKKCQVLCANCHRKKGYLEQRLNEMTGESTTQKPRPNLSKQQRRKNRKRHQQEADRARDEAVKNRSYLSGPDRKDSQ